MANKMSDLMNNDAVIMVVLGFVAMMIGVMTPIIKLNTTIAELNAMLEALKEQLEAFKIQTEQNHQELKERIKVHGTQIDSLVERIVKLESGVEK